MVLVEPRRGQVPFGENDGQDWLDSRVLGQSAGRTLREVPERPCFILAQLAHHGRQDKALDALLPDVQLDFPKPRSTCVTNVERSLM